MKKTTLVLLVFLLGIFLGALDSGIVSPAREIIQNSFNVDASYGTWMITIYTLFYAVSMPIVSKLADIFGYKRTYMLSIALFGLGSFLAGMANFYGTFEFFLVARVIQAIGAGGIIPIANAAISASFPLEKRGFALAMVGGIYGIATILGPTAGSGILHFVGAKGWGWLFLINVPLSLIIIAMSAGISKADMGASITRQKRPLDFAGAMALTLWIASLMYAFTRIDLFDLVNSLQSTHVWPFLLLTALMTPVLVLIEKNAKDPILNLRYFTSSEILKALAIGFFVGIGMMGMVFVPQFGENVLKLKAGTGGYLVTLLAVFSGVAAPISGKIIDSKGPKLTLLIGFGFTIIGTLWMAFMVTAQLSFVSLLVGLALMGLGVGFTMGAPLNYIMLGSVPKEEGTTALATLSVIRSIGVTLSPSLMIGFIVGAAKNMQGNLTAVLEKSFAPMMPKGMNFSAMLEQSGSQATPNGPNPFEALMHADVTTIVSTLKEALAKVLPDQIEPMVNAGIAQSAGAIQNVFQSTINDGYQWMFLASALIATLGFMTTLLLKKKVYVN